MKLPVLDSLVLNEPHNSLGDFTFVCVQHLLETTGSLLESLVSCGARPENIYILGKFYSSNDSVVSRMMNMGVNVFPGSPPSRLGTFEIAIQQDIQSLWEAVQEKQRDECGPIIVIDDGGRCINSIPRYLWIKRKISGVEQTTSGYWERRKHVERSGSSYLRVPTVEIATSAVKRHIEPFMIAEAISDRIARILADDRLPRRCGVVGLGNIGSALTRHLISSHHKVWGYDKHAYKMASFQSSEFVPCRDITQVVDESDIIFGCTGNDIASLIDMKHVRPMSIRTLVSCSSGDVEFRSFLLINDRLVDDDQVLSDVTYNAGNGVIFTIMRGGTPVNFDSTPSSVKANDIQLTRGLLLAAVMQIASGDCQEDEEILSPALQKAIVGAWSGDRIGQEGALGEDKATIDLFTDCNWIASRSVPPGSLPPLVVAAGMAENSLDLLPDNGWSASAQAWIDSMDKGEANRVVLLDPVMLRLCSPRRGMRALDVGCGEGRFCRILKEYGVETTGIDPTGALLTAARNRDIGGEYISAKSEDLPFEDGSFDLVVSYLTLMDISDYRAAIHQMARVLAPGGRLVVCNLDAKITSSPRRWYPDNNKRSFWTVDNCDLEHWKLVDWGGGIVVVNWHRPFSAYMKAFLSEGLLFEAYDEPVPSPDQIKVAPELEGFDRISHFVTLAFGKAHPTASKAG